MGVGVDGGGGARGVSQLTDRGLPAAYSLTVSLCVPLLLTSRCEGDCVHLKLCVWGGGGGVKAAKVGVEEGVCGCGCGCGWGRGCPRGQSVD